MKKDALAHQAQRLLYASIPYYEVFFDGNGKLITWIHENDANFRREYQGPIFEHYGIKVEHFSLPEKDYAALEKAIEESGDLDEELIAKHVKPSLERILKKGSLKKLS
jgi:hypothetical protein